MKKLTNVVGDTPSAPVAPYANVPQAYTPVNATDWFIEESRIRGGFNNTNVDYGVKSSEKANIKFRRSLYIVKDIKKNECITESHIKSIRPGYGLHPKEIENILGRKVTKNLIRGTAIKKAHIDWN